MEVKLKERLSQLELDLPPSATMHRTQCVLSIPHSINQRTLTVLRDLTGQAYSQKSSKLIIWLHASPHLTVLVKNTAHMFCNLHPHHAQQVINADHLLGIVNAALHSMCYNCLHFALDVSAHVS